jgi:hypothetical protein
VQAVKSVKATVEVMVPLITSPVVVVVLMARE